VETSNAELGLRFGSAVERFLEVRGLLDEGQRWLQSVLAIRAPAPIAARASALHVAGTLARASGQYDRSNVCHQESLELYRSIGDERGVLLAVKSLGMVSHYLEEYERAASLYRTSLAMSRASGDMPATADALNSLGVLARNRGDLDGARAFLEESLQAHQMVGDTNSAAVVINNLARVSRDQADWTSAVELSRRSLSMLDEMNDVSGVSMALSNLAVIAQRTGAAMRAVRLFGAAEALREAATGSAFLAVSPAERALCEESVALARKALGEAAFAAVWASGRRLSFDEAVAAGLSPEAESPVTSAVDPLSPREREVAVLIAAGHTNREIGERLVISEWTVDTHVRHILTKLGLRSRAQVAAWVTRLSGQSHVHN
jgi:non-specific serine/threonine protein kinase